VTLLDMLIDRIFGPDQHRPISHGFAAVPTPSIERGWDCEFSGHLTAPGDEEPCVYCGEGT
jgi:hypothetical protein